VHNSTLAFNAMVEQAKEKYATLSVVQEWDSDIWEAKGDFAEGNGKRSLQFSTTPKTTHFDAFKVTNRNYIDWCKSFIVNNYSGKAFGSLGRYVNNMKHLYKALLKVKGSGNPWLLDDAVLEKLEETLIEVDFRERYAVVSYCIGLVKQLKAKGIVLVGISFESSLKRKKDTAQKELNRRRRKTASIDDNERDGENNLISMKALHSLAWLTWNANEWEGVALRLYHILMVSGFRVGELLRLRHDALVSVAEINQETGRPIFVESRDENGNVLLSEDGSPQMEPQMIWGIHYYPEKGHVAAYKWLDPTSAPLVIAAFDFINKKTSACRAQLMRLERNPSKPIQWESETITFKEFNEHFIMVSTDPDREVASRFKGKLKKAGVLSVDNIADTAELARLGPTYKGKTPKLLVYRVADLNRYYHQTLGSDYTPDISFKVGGKGKRKNTVTIRKSELLCIVPDGILSYHRKGSRSIVNHMYPTDLRPHKLQVFFGLQKEGGHPKFSIFARYGLTEEDGSAIQIRSHMPRHQLNTFLALADVAEHQQALIVGRHDINQNRDYQHLSLKDKTRYQGSSTESMRQRIERTQQTIEVTEISPEPEDSLLSELGVVPMGPTPTKLAVQQSMHAFNKPAEHVEFMQEALKENNLLGELQETFNEIREKSGLQAAKDFIEVHGRNFHIVVNGSCTRNLSLHGCDKQLRCLDGEGCFHLMITGRPGEFESIQATHQNLSLNVEKMSRLAQAGKLRSRRERDALEKEKHNLAQMDIVLRKAENFNGFVPIRVFETTKRLNQTGPKKTVVESFAQDQLKFEVEKTNG
tara:strand:+ start:3262 stop:5697 length:2436 start_codon:yes stop_codon:yes gene_type:complete